MKSHTIESTHSTTSRQTHCCPSTSAQWRKVSQWVLDVVIQSSECKYDVRASTIHGKKYIYFQDEAHLFPIIYRLAANFLHTHEVSWCKKCETTLEKTENGGKKACASWRVAATMEANAAAVVSVSSKLHDRKKSITHSNNNGSEWPFWADGVLLSSSLTLAGVLFKRRRDSVRNLTGSLTERRFSHSSIILCVSFGIIVVGYCSWKAIQPLISP